MKSITQRRVALNPVAQLHQQFIMELGMYGEFEAKLFVDRLPKTSKNSLATYWTNNNCQVYVETFLKVGE
jgi:hypothetical protein